ncbi:hypothetical protein H1R20_g6604, partial [Candolleomyces eurysporus]
MTSYLTFVAIVFTLCNAPGLALASVVLAFLIRANKAYYALEKKMQETQARSETTISELQRHMSTLKAELQSTSAHNRALTKMQEAIVELRRKLSTLEAELQSTSARNRVLTEENQEYLKYYALTQEMQAKSETTIAELQRHLSTLEAELHSTSVWNRALVGETMAYMTQIAADTQARETLDQEFEQAKATISVLQRELKDKTKEASDWKDLYLQSSNSPTHRHAVQRGDTPSVSVAGIIAEKDQMIETLRDRLSECYIQLTSRSSSEAATLDSL